MEFLQDIIKIKPNNQNHLDLESRVKPRPGPLRGDDSVPSNPNQQSPSDLIEGLYNRENLEQFFYDKRDFITNLKALFENWVTTMWELVDKAHQNEVERKRLEKI